MKRYDADFYFRNTSLKQRKLSINIIFINVVKALSLLNITYDSFAISVMSSFNKALYFSLLNQINSST